MPACPTQTTSIGASLHSSLVATGEDLLLLFGAGKATVPEATPQILRMTASTRVHVTAGTMYFLSVGTGELFNFLLEGSGGTTGPMLWRAAAGGFGPWQPISANATPAFALSLEGTDPVPEPGTLVLVLTGLAALVRRRATL